MRINDESCPGSSERAGPSDVPVLNSELGFTSEGKAGPAHRGPEREDVTFTPAAPPRALRRPSRGGDGRSSPFAARQADRSGWAGRTLADDNGFQFKL